MKAKLFVVDETSNFFNTKQTMKKKYRYFVCNGGFVNRTTDGIKCQMLFSHNGKWCEPGNVDEGAPTEFSVPQFCYPLARATVEFFIKDGGYSDTELEKLYEQAKRVRV